MNETTEKNIKNMMSLKKSYKHHDTVFLFVSEKSILTVGSDTDILVRFTSVELRITDGMKYGISPKSELDNILPQLVKSGFRVAVCGAIEGENEQTTEPGLTSFKNQPNDFPAQNPSERPNDPETIQSIFQPNDFPAQNPSERPNDPETIQSIFQPNDFPAQNPSERPNDPETIQSIFQPNDFPAQNPSERPNDPETIQSIFQPNDFPAQNPSERPNDPETIQSIFQPNDFPAQNPSERPNDPETIQSIFQPNDFPAQNPSERPNDPETIQSIFQPNDFPAQNPSERPNDPETIQSIFQPNDFPAQNPSERPNDPETIQSIFQPNDFPAQNPSERPNDPETIQSIFQPNDFPAQNPSERLDTLNKLLFRGKASKRTMERMNALGMLPSGNELNDWKSSFLGSFLRKNHKYYGIICQVEKIIGKRPVWADFTRSNIREIVEYYLSECAQSSARTYLALIKSALNDCENKEGIPCREYAAELSVKNIPSVAVYLTMEEIEKLENYKPESESERTILAQFLCSCFTGARHSDILQMTEENIHGKYISYISQKTKKKATIEMKKGLPKLLEQARRNKYADSTFNSTIREICRKAGINDKVRVFHAGKYESGRKYEFVTSHTGRRSFASNLAALGVPLRDISARMGHSSVTITERYILAPENKLSTTAMQYFK